MRDESKGTIQIFRVGDTKVILTHHAHTNFRPGIHPIVALAGNGVF